MNKVSSDKNREYLKKKGNLQKLKKKWFLGQINKGKKEAGTKTEQ